MNEHEPDEVPTDEALDLEGPNEGAMGDNPEVDDVDLEGLEDDDGHPNEDDEY
jgi:hypothetical protein